MQEVITYLAITWSIVTGILILYALIVRSTKTYETAKQFWQVLLLSAAAAYIVSGCLLVFLHVQATFAIMVATLVTFVFGIGSRNGIESSSVKEADKSDSTLPPTRE